LSFKILMNVQVVSTTVTQMRLVRTMEVHSSVAAKRGTLETVDNAQVCTTFYVHVDYPNVETFVSF